MTSSRLRELSRAEAFLVETAARHAAQCVEYERRPVKSAAMDVPMVERAVASALGEIRFVMGGGVSLASPGLCALPPFALRNDAEKYADLRDAVAAFLATCEGRGRVPHYVASACATFRAALAALGGEE